LIFIYPILKQKDFTENPQKIQVKSIALKLQLYMAKLRITASKKKQDTADYKKREN